MSRTAGGSRARPPRARRTAGRPARLTRLATLLALVGALDNCKSVDHAAAAARLRGVATASAEDGGRFFLLFATSDKGSICLAYCDKQRFSAGLATGAALPTEGAERICREATRCVGFPDFYGFWKDLQFGDATAKADLLGDIFNNNVTAFTPFVHDQEAAGAALAPKVRRIEDFFVASGVDGKLTPPQAGRLLTAVTAAGAAEVAAAHDPLTGAFKAAQPQAAARYLGRYYWGLKAGTYRRTNANPLYAVALRKRPGAGLRLTLAFDPLNEDSARPVFDETYACDVGSGTQVFTDDTPTTCLFRRKAQDTYAEYRLTVTSATSFTLSGKESSGTGTLYLDEMNFVNDDAILASPPEPASAPVDGAPAVFCNMRPMIVGGAGPGTAPLDAGALATIRRDFGLFLASRDALWRFRARAFEGARSGTPEDALIASCRACMHQAPGQLQDFMNASADGGVEGLELSCAEPVCYTYPGFAAVEPGGPSGPAGVGARQLAAGFADVGFTSDFLRACSLAKGDDVLAKRLAPTWQLDRLGTVQPGQAWAAPDHP